MKTHSVPLKAHYALPERTLATYWKVTRTDGEVFGFTDHDQPSSPLDGVTYEAFSGFTPSQLSTNASLSVDNMEVTGLFDSSGITDADLEAGRWDNAVVEIFEANYLDFTMGRNVLLRGTLGQVKPNGGLFVAELRSLTAKLQKNVGRTTLPTCDAILGDARCGVDLEPLTATGVAVTSVPSRLVFHATSLLAAVGYYDWGVVTFETGANAGYSSDVKTYGLGGIITLQIAFPYLIDIADLFAISPGCNKLHKTGEAEYLGDCKVKYNNVVNFQGFPEVPSANQTIQRPGL